MAAQSDLAREYVARAEKMKWKDLAVLWNEIKSGTVKDWDAGKALEHLVVRGFILSGLEAEYPYDVPPGGKPIEQIDGLVELESLTFLIECKDKNSVAIEAIAKLINQLLRRPQTTFGCVFTSGEFTPNALLLVDLVPHRILFWTRIDINVCVKNRDFRKMLNAKYRNLCKYGLSDHSPNYEEDEVVQ